MNEETCPDCGLPLAKTLAHWFQFTGVAMCAARFEENDDNEQDDVMAARCHCLDLTKARLRSQLSAATARASELERECDDYREGARAEAKRCDELLAERNRARNETLVSLGQLADATDEVAGMSRSLVQFEAELAQRDADLAAMGERVARAEEALRLAAACVKAGTMGQNDGVMTWHDWAGNMLRHLNPLTDALAKLGLLQPETKGT